MEEFSQPVNHPIRKTSTEWRKNKDFVLKLGQQGIITDRHGIYIGDGITPIYRLIPILPAIDNIDPKSKDAPITMSLAQTMSSNYMIWKVYVDGDRGNDYYGDGSEENPYKDLDFALSNAPSRDGLHVIIKRGQYVISKEHTFWNSYLRISGLSDENGNKPIIVFDPDIKNDNPAIFSFKAGCSFYIDGLQFITAINGSRCIYDRYSSSGGIITNCTFENFYSPIQAVGSNWNVSYCTFKNCVICLHTFQGSILSNNNKSINCEYGVSANFGVIYIASDIKIEGKLGNLTSGGGQIIESAL